MAINKARGQSDEIMEVLFVLTISGGAVSIVGVFPPVAVNDISVADGGAGLSTITIKNMKGKQGQANVQLTPRTTSMMSANVTPAYSGEDLSFVVSTESDASTATDNVSVDVQVKAY